MGKAKHLKYLRRESRKAIEGLGIDFNKQVKPKPKWFPRWAWNILLKILLKSPDFYLKKEEENNKEKNEPEK